MAKMPYALVCRHRVLLTTESWKASVDGLPFSESERPTAVTSVTLSAEWLHISILQVGTL